MNAQRPFLTFITHAHRRRILWRFAEDSAIGLLVASGVGSIVLAIAWWRGIDALAASISIMCVGVVAGFVASIRRRPTLLQTATLIDAQLNSPELLSSALLSNNAEFVDALHAMADARVTGVGLASLVFRRFGPRTFVGAGLAGSMVLVVAMMLSSPIARSIAMAGKEDRAGDDVEHWIRHSELPQRERTPTAASERTRPPQRDPDSAGSRVESDLTDSRAAPTHRESNGPSSSADGGGDGAARTSRADENQLESDHTNRSATNAGTLEASGTGNSIPSSTPGVTSGNQTNGVSSPPTIAPWRSDTWLRDRDAALQAVRNGAVPDAYRSLVQDYFRRD